MLKNSNLSHYQMIRNFVETFQRWGKATYIGFNSIESTKNFLRSTFLRNFEKTYIMNTNGNSEADLLHVRATHLYYPEKLKLERHQKIIQNLN